jgi:RNA polymerase sigma factor (sigma-70 family)
MNDNELISQLINPETRRHAFGVLVKQYSEKLYWQIRRIVLDHDDANDVMQNTFLKAWNNIDSFRNDSKLFTWLMRIAINESLDFVRKKSKLISIDITENIAVAAKLLADKYFDGDEIQAQLQQAINTLPDVQRAVFNMRYYDEMKYSEMSRILNTSEGALKASYHIAVKKICDYFNNHD